MKLSTALSGALAVAASVIPASAAPSVPHEKRQSGGIVTTGVTGNGVQIRQELRTMQRNNPDQFNVYLLALRRMMATPQNNILSYYQIAGIHGRPYVSYDGEMPINNGPAQGYGGGYCTHASNIFLTWHRPYLALYEQILYKHVNDIANEFPNDGRRQRYQAAASNFRIPYWDWAAQPCAECLPYPRLVSQMYLDVDTPNGRQTLMNPLFRYNFTAGPPTEMAYNPFATWTWTRRFPSSWDVNNAWSQNDQIAEQVKNNQANWRQRIYNLLTNRDNDFYAFSSSAYQSSTGQATSDSMEGLHDTIHALIGSTGHMAYLDYSAFDPIFFLHHVMVDRLWTMWAATHDQPSDVGNWPSQGSTFVWPRGTSISQTTGLSPFHRDSNRRLWTSNDVASTTTFGYAYPEGTDRGTVNQAINNLYRPATQRRKRDLAALSKRTDDHHYQYIANIASQKFQVNGTYGIYVFLGEPSANAADWGTSDKLVGMHGVTANFNGEANGMNQMDVLVTGSVPLTDKLVDKCDSGELASLEPSVVEPYLEEAMQWRVARFDGSIVDAKDVPGLSVSVVTSDVRPPAVDTEQPVWGHFSSMAKVTINKAGGHSDKLWSFKEKWSLGELVNSGMGSGKFFTKKYNRA
ncbi:Tyrosinase-like protein 9 [Elsinoe fawcettii]|nr:Tyrosinase-like protein 9 [Elsinoe fawcettii]